MWANTFLEFECVSLHRANCTVSRESKKHSQKKETKNGGLLAPKKQIELQYDLEKHHTIGLRCQDGHIM